jgi:hypothetical protein
MHCGWRGQHLLQWGAGAEDLDTDTVNHMCQIAAPVGCLVAASNTTQYAPQAATASDW